MTALPPSGCFSMVDAAHVAEVGPAAALLFARIVWRSQHDGSWRASRTLLAQETGLSPAMIKTAVQVLRDRGWVTTERTSIVDATLIWTPVCPSQGQVAESATPPMAESAMTQGGIDPATRAESAFSSSQTEDLLDVDLSVDAPPELPLLSVVRDPEPDFDEEFAGFWRVYPTRKGKQAARRKYEQARKVASLQQIADGLRAQLPELTEKHERGYGLHPATWLHQRRWEDDVQAPRPEAAPRGKNFLLSMSSGAAFQPPEEQPYAALTTRHQ